MADTAPTMKSSVSNVAAELANTFKKVSTWIEEAGGIRPFVHELPFWKIEELIQSVVTDDPEVMMILELVRFLTDVTLPIDDKMKELSQQVTCNWMSHSVNLFTPRFMYDFSGSSYFELLAQIEKPTPKEIISAWLSDLRNGLYPVCRNLVVCHFDDFLGNFANDREYAQGMAQLLIDNDLIGEFRAVPSAMIELARLSRVSMYLPK